jgi:23S rRNA (cytosine1962-C5)-methyltransferase
VRWARENAAAAGLDQHPIRWIVDDVRKFVAREVRRGSTYDAVILDPPTYGHGPKSQLWQLADDLPPLLQACGALLAGDESAMVLSCHAPGVEAEDLLAMIRQGISQRSPQDVAAGPLPLTTAGGRVLNSGVAVRCMLAA